MNQPPLSIFSPATGLTLVPGPTRARTRAFFPSPSRLRRFSFQEGRALELLGHAIEYLADEYTLACRSPSGPGKAPEVEAIELLMRQSREIYFNAQPSPTLLESLRSWFGLART